MAEVGPRTRGKHGKGKIGKRDRGHSIHGRAERRGRRGGKTLPEN